MYGAQVEARDEGTKEEYEKYKKKQRKTQSAVDVETERAKEV